MCIKKFIQKFSFWNFYAENYGKIYVQENFENM